MKIFELGPGRKFRARAGSHGVIQIEIRQPDRWELVTAPDLLVMATNALALAAVDEPPQGFAFTNDDRFVDPKVGPRSPFAYRR